MSRPIPNVDNSENEQPTQAAQAALPERVCPSSQESVQSQTRAEVPAAVSRQTNSPPQGPVRAAQRPSGPQRQLHQRRGQAGEEGRPEPEPQSECSQAPQLPAPGSLGPCPSAQDDDARGSAPPVHFSRPAPSVDASVSETTPTRASVFCASSCISSGSQFLFQRTLPCPTTPIAILPAPGHRSEEGERRQHPGGITFATSSDTHREIRLYRSQPCTRNAPEPTSRNELNVSHWRGSEVSYEENSESSGRKDSETSIRSPAKSSLGERPGFTAEKNTKSCVRKEPGVSPGAESKSGVRERSICSDTDSSTVHSCKGNGRRRFSASENTSATVDNKGYEERAGSPVHSTPTASQKAGGWGGTLPPYPPSSQGSRESAKSSLENGFEVWREEWKREGPKSDLTSNFTATTDTTGKQKTKSAFLAKHSYSSATQGEQLFVYGTRRHTSSDGRVDADANASTKVRAAGNKERLGSRSTTTQRFLPRTVPDIASSQTKLTHMLTATKPCAPDRASVNGTSSQRGRGRRTVQRKRQGGGGMDVRRSDREDRGGDEQAPQSVISLSQSSDGPCGTTSGSALDSQDVMSQTTATIPNAEIDENDGEVQIQIKQEMADDYPQADHLGFPTEAETHISREGKTERQKHPETFHEDSQCDVQHRQGSSPQQWSILFETTMPQTTTAMDAVEKSSDEDTKEDIDTVHYPEHALSSHVGEESTSFGTRGEFHELSSQDRLDKRGSSTTDITEAANKMDCFELPSVKTTAVAAPQTVDGESVMMRKTVRGGGRRKQKTPRQLQQQFSWQSQRPVESQSVSTFEPDAKCPEQEPHNTEEQEAIVPREATGCLVQSKSKDKTARTSHQGLAASLIQVSGKSFNLHTDTSSTLSLDLKKDDEPNTSSSPSLQHSTFVYSTGKSFTSQPIRENVLQESVRLSEVKQLERDTKTCGSKDISRTHSKNWLSSKITFDIPTGQIRTVKTKMKRHTFAKTTGIGLQKRNETTLMDDVLRVDTRPGRVVTKSPSSVDNHPLLQRRPYINRETKMTNGMSRRPQNHQQFSSQDQLNSAKSECLTAPKKVFEVRGGEKDEMKGSPQSGRFSCLLKSLSKRANGVYPVTKRASEYTNEASVAHQFPSGEKSVSTKRMPAIKQHPGNRYFDTAVDRKDTDTVELFDDGEDTTNLSPERLNISVRNSMSLKDSCAPMAHLQQKEQRQLSLSSSKKPRHHPDEDNCKHPSKQEWSSPQANGASLSPGNRTARKTKRSENVNERAARQFTEKKNVYIPVMPKTVERLQYSPIPLYSSAFPAEVSALTQGLNQTSSLSPATMAVGLPGVNELMKPCFVPIVPKMSDIMQSLQTPLSIYGSHQAPRKSPHDCVQPPVSQIGFAANQVFPACRSGIPVLIYVPNVNQTLTLCQLQTDMLNASGLATTTLPTHVNQECPERRKISGMDVSSSQDSNDGQLEMTCTESENKVNEKESWLCSSSRSEEAQLSKDNHNDLPHITQPRCCSDSSQGSSEGFATGMSKRSKSSQAEDTLTSPKSGMSTNANFPIESQGICANADVVPQDEKQKSPERLGNDGIPLRGQSRDESHVNFEGNSDSKTTCEATASDMARVHKEASFEAIAEKPKRPEILKSGRKRTASKRYNSQSDTYLSDATDYDDMTPMTSDDEWTPEKDNDGHLGHSSEDDEPEHMSERRELEDLLRPVNKEKNRKATQFDHSNKIRKKQRTITRNHQKDNIKSVKIQVKTNSSTDDETSPKTRKEIGDELLTNLSMTKSAACTRRQQRSYLQKETTACPGSYCSTCDEHAPKRRRSKTPYTEADLTCRICSKTFVNIYRLRRHESSHGDERPYLCDVCGKAFKQSGHRNEHRLTHNANKRSFLCNVCGVVINSRSSFRYHLLSHKQLLQGMIKTSSCEIVSPAPDSGTLQQCVEPVREDGVAGHAASSSADPATYDQDAKELMSDVAAYDCPHCVQRFATAQSLNCHLESHLEVELRCHVQPFVCPECERCFTYRHNLEKHRQCHRHPEKRADSYQKKVQAAVEAGKPHFVCDTCGKVYLRKETLTKHSKTHLGLKPFQCKRRLKKGAGHMKCGLCPWTGKHQGFLKRHVLRCHPNQDAVSMESSP